MKRNRQQYETKNSVMDNSAVLLTENNFSVLFSRRDKASGITLSSDSLTLYGCQGGYKMARASHGVHSGNYYFEVHILDTCSETSHFRIGWASRQAELEGPVGYDNHSFAYRDIDGSKVHNSIREDKYGESYAPGDVVGCFIKLDDTNENNNEIRFFKNGKCQGVAYSGNIITTAIYFPAVSIYMKGEVSINFGPSFIFRHDIPGANAMSEVQPMDPSARKIHENRIATIRQSIMERREEK